MTAVQGDDDMRAADGIGWKMFAGLMVIMVGAFNVADGLVARLRCADDARGAYAVLTDRGRARLEEARPKHLTAVKRYFVESFTRAELETLADLMERSIPTD